MSLQVFGALCYLLLLLSMLPAASSCGSILRSGVSPQEKHLILDVHNKLRQLVATGQVPNQPPAAKMMKMVWSDALAAKAQRWATSCVSEIHDPGRHSGEYYVGQNIATRWTTKVPTSSEDTTAQWYLDAISKWFQENALYNYDSNNMDHRTGHYTQLVWADTMAVGCGFALTFDGNRRYTKKYVCNYGPSGNIIGEEPYDRGYPTCYNYGLTNSRTSPGLCEKGPNSNSYRNSIPFIVDHHLKDYVVDVFHF